jgi:hypothetical protein
MGLLSVLAIQPLKVSSRGIDKVEAQALVVLQPEDALPPDAVKLKELSLGGNRGGPDCANYELLLQAKSMASEAGANILKIRARSTHSRKQSCDGLDIAFYQTANPHKAEQSFTWNPSRKLSWDDFNGPVRDGSGTATVAETSCGISVETNLATARGKATVYVFNIFDKRTSWVRPGKELAVVLEHEQGHWDICELYTRRMQARFDAAEITGATLNRKVSEIYNAVTNEFIERQEQYEEDTRHGTLSEEQQRWTKLIAEELERL